MNDCIGRIVLRDGVSSSSSFSFVHVNSNLCAYKPYPRFSHLFLGLQIRLICEKIRYVASYSYYSTEIGLYHAGSKGKVFLQKQSLEYLVQFLVSMYNTLNINLSWSKLLRIIHRKLR